MEKETSKKADISKQKTRSNPKKDWIRFFPPEGTTEADEALREINDCQLMVHGLPSEFPIGTPGGPQDDALNNLIKSLGIILKQAHIVGAYPAETKSSNDKSSVVRLTVNSKATKETIRKAAEVTHRWGGGNHKVFLRDIVKRKRTSSNEDPRTPKKKKLEDTPKPRPKRGLENRDQLRGENPNRQGKAGRGGCQKGRA